MTSLQRCMRIFCATGAISFAASGPTVLRLGTMAGAIKPGVAVSVATGASVIAGGIKLLAKSSASGAGKYLTAKAGAGALVKGSVNWRVRV